MCSLLNLLLFGDKDVSFLSAAVGGSVARFFDEVNTKPKPTKPNQPTVAKSQTKTKAKKEEDLVMKLFENKLPNSSKSDEFNKWCHKTLSGFPNNFDSKL